MSVNERSESEWQAILSPQQVLIMLLYTPKARDLSIDHFSSGFFAKKAQRLLAQASMINILKTACMSVPGAVLLSTRAALNLIRVAAGPLSLTVSH